MPIILGVTNPFFSKTLQHWPHLIRLADNNNGMCGRELFFQFSIDRPISISSFIFAGSSLLSSGAYGNATNSPAPSQQQGLRKLRIFAKLLDTPPGVYTQYKPFLQKDKNVIRNLLAGVKKQRPAEVQSAILRRHLLELTQSFMIPLERYMASLMPLQKGKCDGWMWAINDWIHCIQMAFDLSRYIRIPVGTCTQPFQTGSIFGHPRTIRTTFDVTAQRRLVRAVQAFLPFTEFPRLVREPIQRAHPNPTTFTNASSLECGKCIVNDAVQSDPINSTKTHFRISSTG